MAEKAHTEVPPKGHFPPFERETFASQLFWFAVLFVALYVIISRLAIPRMDGITNARRQRVEGDLEEARRLKDESTAAMAAYEKALADARARAQALANEARDKYAAEAEAARKTLDETLNARLAEAEQTIAARRTAALAHVEEIAVDTASAIVERLIGRVPDRNDVVSAVGNTVKR
jgi:F-type H+-transporting ATPase subunit b